MSLFMRIMYPFHKNNKLTLYWLLVEELTGEGFMLSVAVVLFRSYRMCSICCLTHATPTEDTFLSSHQTACDVADGWKNYLGTAQVTKERYLYS
ncbi:hypothetical protein DMENIID0001_153530 [Sergentomyia squamirostris]